MTLTLEPRPQTDPQRRSNARHDWRLDEVRALYDAPLLDLVFRAAEVHRRFHDPREVQVCKLINIKTGACPEDCKYCSQSSRYQTEVKPEPLMDKGEVLDIATRAKAAGVTRVCMGAAWREVRDNAQFDRVLDMVKDVTALGLEVCCTLGMLTDDQARRLDEAGLYAYNHNLDTSERFYETIITTRTYADRLRHARQRPQDGRDRLLRRDHRPGRNGRGPRLDAAHAGVDGPAPGIGPDQRPEQGPRHAAGRQPGRAGVGSGPDDRDRPHPHAGIRRPPVGGAGEAVGQRPGPLLHGRGQFDLLQR